VKALLASARTGFLLVTSPNAMTVEEALHFHTLLVQKELHVSAVIANRVHPPPRPTVLRSARSICGRPSSGWPNGPHLERRVALAVADAQLLWDKDQEQVRRMTAAGIRPLQVPSLDGEVHDLPALRELAMAMASADEARGLVAPGEARGSDGSDEAVDEDPRATLAAGAFFAVSCASVQKPSQVRCSAVTIVAGRPTSSWPPS